MPRSLFPSLSPRLPAAVLTPTLLSPPGRQGPPLTVPVLSCRAQPPLSRHMRAQILLSSDEPASA